MLNAFDIAKMSESDLIEPYVFPLWLPSKPRIPVNPHPGSFGAVRKYDRHAGVDLYIPKKWTGARVLAMEAGIVIGKVPFTGEQSSPPTPWWEETDAVLVLGETGLIVYGEITQDGMEDMPIPGEKVIAGQVIGKTKPVLKIDKGRPMEMLHIELLDHSRESEAPVWPLSLSDHKALGIYDPTQLLIQANLKR